MGMSDSIDDGRFEARGSRNPMASTGVVQAVPMPPFPQWRNGAQRKQLAWNEAGGRDGCKYHRR